MRSRLMAQAIRWKRGWPTQPGIYIVQLYNGDRYAFTVAKYTTDDGHVGLEAYDDMDGVYYEPPDFTPLEQYWGRVLASYGPIPKYRQQYLTKAK